MSPPTHKTPRELRLAQDLANATVLLTDEVEALIEVLQREPRLMSALMAVCARPGPAANDSDWEFHAGSDGLPRAWLHGGSGLDVSHHLPEPNEP